MALSPWHENGQFFSFFHYLPGPPNAPKKDFSLQRSHEHTLPAVKVFDLVLKTIKVYVCLCACACVPVCVDSSVGPVHEGIASVLHDRMLATCLRSPLPDSLSEPRELSATCARV